VLAPQRGKEDVIHQAFDHRSGSEVGGRWHERHLTHRRAELCARRASTSAPPASHGRPDIDLTDDVSSSPSGLALR
jgi:hypothetical protein